MKINCVSSFTVPLFQKEKSTESSPSISRYNSLKEKTIIHNLYHLSIYIYPLKGDEPTLPVPQLFWRPRHLVLIFYRNSTLFVFFYRTSTLLVFFLKKLLSFSFIEFLLSSFFFKLKSKFLGISSVLPEFSLPSFVFSRLTRMWGTSGETPSGSSEYFEEEQKQQQEKPERYLPPDLSNLEYFFWKMCLFFNQNTWNLFNLRVLATLCL